MFKSKLNICAKTKETAALQLKVFFKISHFMAAFFMVFLTLNTVGEAQESQQPIDTHIQKELSSFSEITLQQLNETEESLKSMNTAFMRVKVAQGEMNYQTFAAPIYQARINGFARLLNKLAPRLPNLDFIILLDDGFDQEVLIGSNAAPLFCISKLKTQDRLLSIPEAHAYPYDNTPLDNFYAEIEDRGAKFPWNEKSEIAFWRGSLTGGRYPLQENSLKPRVLLEVFSENYPEHLDCKLNQFVSPSSQLKYKYLIAIDGNTFPSSLKWQLFSGSVVLKNESEWVEWFNYALIPFEHYVPYKIDFSDLLEKIIWLNQNDEIAKKIAEQAKQFAKCYLTSENIEAYVYKLLVAYSKLQKAQ